MILALAAEQTANNISRPPEHVLRRPVAFLFSSRLSRRFPAEGCRRTQVSKCMRIPKEGIPAL